MMRSIAIFNNKGGVGKSTLALLLADFLSSSSVSIGDRRARVLVVDLDAQGSSATALVGQAAVSARQKAGTTISGLLHALLRRGRPSLDDYLILRPEAETRSRKIPLGRLWTLVSDGEGTLDLEERYKGKIAEVLYDHGRPLLANAFDIVLFDLPANIDRRNFLPMAALQASDFILTPTEPTRITINALEHTFDIVRDVQGAARQAGHKVPRLTGVVLNKTDRRTRQYTLHVREIEALARRNDTTVFRNFLPPATVLANAADDSLEFDTLRERYDTYYDHVRKVTRELAERCGLVTPTRAGERAKKA